MHCCTTSAWCGGVVIEHEAFALRRDDTPECRPRSITQHRLCCRPIRLMLLHNEPTTLLVRSLRFRAGPPAGLGLRWGCFNHTLVRHAAGADGDPGLAGRSASSRFCSKPGELSLCRSQLRCCACTRTPIRVPRVAARRWPHHRLVRWCGTCVRLLSHGRIRYARGDLAVPSMMLLLM